MSRPLLKELVVVALGLALLVLCLVLGTGVALTNTEAVRAELFGVSLSNLSVGGFFLLGAGLGALAMLGLGLMLLGAARRRAKKQALQREVRSARGEQESLAEENARLQAELEQTHSTPVAPPRESSPLDNHGDSGRKA